MGKRGGVAAIRSFKAKAIEGWDALPGRLLARGFFEAPPDEVAPRLLGKLLVHRTKGGVLAGRIVETEAYLGPHHDPPDPAAHAYRGPTPRNVVLFGPAAHAYVYAIYGRCFCMNISCEGAGRAGCVLLRALEPVAGVEEMARNRGMEPDARGRDGRVIAAKLASGLASGPGRLCQALGLTRAGHNGLDLLDEDSPLQVRDDGYWGREILVTARIGIHVAADWPMRFAYPDHKSVSGPKSLAGRRIFLR